MSQDNESKSPTVEAQEKKPTEVPTIEVNDDEKIKTEKQPEDEKLTEKIEEQKIIVPMEEMNPTDVEPIVTEKTIPETITKDISDQNKEAVTEAVAEIIAKNADEIVVAKEAEPNVVEKKQNESYATDDEKEGIDPKVPADEIALKKDAEVKEKEESKANNEPLKIEEAVTVTTDVKKDDEALENKVTENEKEKKDVQKPELENVKTETKEEEKVADEIKLMDSNPKEDEKASPKQSVGLMGKVKKSFWKAKKAMIGKSNTTPTNKTPETKEDEKA